MGETLEHEVTQIKQVTREILGALPSQMFLGRIDKALDECAYDREKLCIACRKVEGMVRLFIGVEEARELGVRYGEILR